MEQVRARDEEAQFFALEQKSLRHHPDTKMTVKLFSWLYEITSDYGQSFARPLAWLLGVTAIFFWIYANAFIPDSSLSFVFTIEQIVRPFIVWTSSYTDSIQGAYLTTGLRLLASLQSLISLGLLTLFILAVRRRFKME